MKRIVIGGIAILAAGVILLSVLALLLETDPPMVKEPAWDSPQTRALAVRACFDCHSNQTRWPWFTRVPGGSWIAVLDTIRGRRALNFSDWSAAQLTGEHGSVTNEIPRVIDRGSMPPAVYTMMHPDAVLSATEKQQLIQGLQASLK